MSSTSLELCPSESTISSCLGSLEHRARVVGEAHPLYAWLERGFGARRLRSARRLVVVSIVLV